ncbi:MULTISPECIES: hypothetical protein [Burkholderia]|jgi:hypothetical protein|uniref:hypothetical protein n=1 Tax=Burkholderia TaxID=32008 RepID=UPI001CF578BC|nr:MULTISPECIES: hypothetical protein [Burkholderia]MCA3777431.1 hypothetical protein [Burkholderia sp.]MCA3792374.1 hypothetical protein [Burkholderia sp.]MCA3806174.1 hypothetical protein [Burkholderia sp.]MCA3830210.1 hypothetical protein [Burkholderia sp.]MCA3835957.1 hypothetical protein [Burkholderia sp.]
MSITHRTSRLAGELGVFAKRYGRKAQKHLDPNDRRYDHDVERTMRRLSPADLSDLLAGDEAEGEYDIAPGSADTTHRP